MGFLFFIAVIGVIVYLSTQSTKSSRQQWRTAAGNLNLGYYEGGLGSTGTISGERSGHSVTVSTHTKGSGGNSQPYTKYQMEYRDHLPLDLRMTRQGAMHTLGKAFGLQDIEVGNPSFDDVVIVRGSRPAEVRRFLAPRLQDAIRTLILLYPDIVISSKHVVVKKAGKDMDPVVICHCIRRLEAFCSEMVRANAAASKVGVFDTAMDEASPVSVTEEPDLPDPVIIEPAYDPLHSADPVIPIPPEVPPDPGALSETAEVAAVVASPAPEEQPDEVESSPPAVLELTQVAEELFSGDSGQTLLSSKLFEDKFRNHPVEGSGTMKRAGKFSYDPVFTNTRGVKATLMVCELAGTYSKVKVTAEVMFPPEALETLKAKVGSRLSVRGKLVGMDAMMNQLYIVAD